MTTDNRAKVLSDYRKRLLEHREMESKVKECKSTFSSLNYFYHSYPQIGFIFLVYLISEVITEFEGVPFQHLWIS